MKFVRVDNLAQAAVALRDRLDQQIRNGSQVLWLMSGGSLIQLATDVMDQLDDALTSKLTVLLMDERYGEPGHADSNDRKLADAGFDSKQASWVRVLQDGLTMEETTKIYARTARSAIAAADTVIGLFGMGVDGHIAGIKPGSPAVTSADFAICYDWEDYRRITLTPSALNGVHTAYLVAFGHEKRQQLELLQSSDIPMSEQPAQLLKQLPEAYIYNDQIGDSV